MIFIKQSMYIKSVRNAKNYYYFFHFHLTQHVSALDGHLQVSEYVETATLHQCSFDRFRHLKMAI
jgi:hypothetical protein